MNPPTTVVSIEMVIRVVFSNADAEAVFLVYGHVVRIRRFGYAPCLMDNKKSRTSHDRLLLSTGECLNSDFSAHPVGASCSQKRTIARHYTTAASLVARLAALARRSKPSIDAWLKNDGVILSQDGTMVNRYLCHRKIKRKRVTDLRESRSCRATLRLLSPF